MTWVADIPRRFVEPSWISSNLIGYMSIGTEQVFDEQGLGQWTNMREPLNNIAVEDLIMSNDVVGTSNQVCIALANLTIESLLGRVLM